MRRFDAMAASATLHCLTGCAIGEIIGLLIGTQQGWGNLPTTVLSVALAFVFGYSLSSLPVVLAGIDLGSALKLVLAADTLSIATMEIVDNTVMLSVPGAMDAGLDRPLFWLSMMLSFVVAFAAAYPVNRYLMNRGKGHALTHEYMGHDEHAGHGDHDEHAPQRRSSWTGPQPTTLAVGIAAFMLGGLVVATGIQMEDSPPTPPHSLGR
ncbi:DUF4396 domain-containing protein [Luteipulveratus flavus]|uniref:DUF4396 domain-containing protein n=1 Tax=Luteipulveratus flavus TaxID=3031728 RepID=A0ABT6C4I5_9MICO|nr:DUF4396 domain-containing protein [Luteipulveratus sp. YIM 133296]MDF8262959.1 DUF4396 domain-containing protein [Luteipulveratus sp. YIM 133296]